MATPDEEPEEEYEEPEDAPEPMSSGGFVEAPETMSGMQLISQLVVRDMSDDSLTPLGDTITLGDYPEGFNIRAEAASDDIRTVTFETDTGISEVEKREYYDMFSNRGSWPNPTPGMLPTSPSCTFSYSSVSTRGKGSQYKCCRFRLDFLDAASLLPEQQCRCIYPSTEQFMFCCNHLPHVV